MQASHPPAKQVDAPSQVPSPLSGTSVLWGRLPPCPSTRGKVRPPTRTKRRPGIGADLQPCVDDPPERVPGRGITGQMFALADLEREKSSN